MSKDLTVVYQNLSYDERCAITNDPCAVRFRHGCAITELSNKDALLRQALEALVDAEKDAADFQRINTDQTGAAITAIRQHLGDQT